MTTFKAACVQVSASDDMDANLRMIGDLVRRARDEGAEFVTTPENVAMMITGSANLRAKAAPEASHPALAAFRALARETEAWLLAGSLHVKLDDEDRLANRSYLVSPAGEVVAKYDKIHMFDVDLPSGESYRESKNFRPGGEAVLAELPWCRLGMTVCYDLRFPEIYRKLVSQGARIITVPAAFTLTTGKDHWHVLLRARAIENQVYVLAPAQHGKHPKGRQTYGKSVIVDPWGDVLAQCPEGEGFAIANLDFTAQDRVRAALPCLSHRRM